MLYSDSTVPPFGNASWSLPRKAAPTSGSAIPQSHLTGGFENFYHSDRKDGVVDIRTRRHYEARRATESMERKTNQRLRDRPAHREADRGKGLVVSPLRDKHLVAPHGKKFLMPTIPLVRDVDPSPTGQHRGQVMHVSGTCNSRQYRSKEQVIAEAMTRKGRMTSLLSMRNDMPVRCPGDKPYADTAYSKGFYARRDSSVVYKAAAASGPSRGPDYAKLREIDTVRNLPKIK